MNVFGFFYRTTFIRQVWIIIFTINSLFSIPLISCPVGDVQLGSQADIDAFAATYPNCTTISGYLYIFGPDITDLSPLANITTIEGYLQISDCPILVSSVGLSGVTTIDGDLYIGYNNKLTTIGLNNLQSIGGAFSIEENAVLPSLTGLNNLSSVKDFWIFNNPAIFDLGNLSSLTTIEHTIEILGNLKLNNLIGLGALTTLGNALSINGNPELISLEGLHNINAFNGDIDINNNATLTTCAITSICRHLSNGGLISVGTNGPSGCNSQIEIENICTTIAPDWKLIFPPNSTITCQGTIPKPDSPSDIITSNGNCFLSLNVVERLFRVPADACLKLERTYTVWNDCGTPDIIYNANNAGVIMVTSDDTNAQQIVYTQTIKMELTESPKIQLEPIDTDIYAIDCQDPKTLTISAYNCLDLEIPITNITWTLIGDSKTLTGIGRTIAFDAIAGTYDLEIWAIDACGNTSSLSESITFIDARAPAIWLLNGLTQILPASGTVDIWANDFIANVVDCDAYTIHIWHESLGAAPASCEEVRSLGQFVALDCDHIGRQIVRIYAIDATGNCDFVETFLLLQDNGNICDDIHVDEEVNIAGKITTSSGELVELVNVSSNGGLSDAMTTNSSGSYAFTVPKGGDYTITPEKELNPLNGVSTFDLVLISKHILNIQNFTSPYHYIAADINRSGTITAFDMVQLRQLILNINTEFANNASWRFVEASYDFGSDPSTTLLQNFPEITNINNIDVDKLNIDFIAIKIGDVNGNSSPNSIPSNGNTIPNEVPPFLELKVLSQEVVDFQNTITVPVKVNQFIDVAGLEFILDWDSSILEYIGADIISPIGGYKGDTKARNGNLFFLWYDEEGGKRDLSNNTTLFEAKFRVIRPVNTTIGFDETTRQALVVTDINGTLAISRPIIEVGQITFPASAIPTMSEWGVVIFCLLILNLSVTIIRKKEAIILKD